KAERAGDLLFALGVNFQGRGADHPEAGEDLRFTEWNFRVQYNYLPRLNPVEPLEKSIIATEQALQEEIARLGVEWATAERSLLSAEERVKVAEKNVEVARNSFEATQARFRVGFASILDVIHSENLLLSAQLNLVEAHFEVLLNRAKLAFLLGEG
ncbi:MAG: TolC family protein, partial [bacterium]